MSNNRTLWLLAGLAGAGALYWLWQRSSSSGDSADGSDSGSATDAITNFFSTAATRVMNAATSRGYRNNNPGNIRYLSSNAWDGQIGNDNGYGIYESPEKGTRALGHQLQAYANRGIDNVFDIINTYAPSSDGNNTAEYIADVANQLGVDPNASIDVNGSLADLAAAIARHENGYLSSDYDWQWVYLP